MVASRRGGTDRPESASCGAGAGWPPGGRSRPLCAVPDYV